MNDPVLHVQMLGGFALRYGPLPVPPVPSRTATSLLAFLILRRERPQTRDLLAGRFWSDLAEDKARRRLSNALWQIGNAFKAVGVEEVFDKTTTTVSLRSDLAVTVDAEQFEVELDAFERSRRTDRTGAGSAELAGIVEMYRGDLLVGHYDEWIDDQRQKVRERYLMALDQLVQLYTGEADYDIALRHARALVAAEPLSEEWHRQVMRLCSLNGQPSAAERQFAECRKILGQELGVEPSAETAELADRIRREGASVQAAVFLPTDGLQPTFVGRGHERAALLGRVNEVVGGKGGIVLVEGEPGIGKSRLLEEVARGADWRGVQVLLGRHTPTSALNPYDGLREALAPAIRGVRAERLVANVPAVWVRQAAMVLEGLAPYVDPPTIGGRPNLRPEEEPWRTTEALVQIVLGLGRPKPAMLVLEDIHWSDDDTMQVLSQLGERLIDSGVLICVSYQRHEAQQAAAVWQTLSRLEAMPGASRVVVPPLELDETRALVTGEVGPNRMTSPMLQQFHGLSGGNPFVLLELVRGPVDLFDMIGPDGADVGTAALGDDLGPTVAAIVSRRIDGVAPEVRAVLEGVSAMTGPVGTAVVAAAVGMSRAEVAGALVEGVEAGLLVETARGCEFAQEQTRRAVYEAIPAEVRRAIHGRIVDALIGEPQVRVAQLAHHAWLAEHWQRAYQYHSLAAEAALKVNAFHTTVEHYAKADHAAAASGLSDADRLDDLFAYERVLDVLGRRGEQRDLLDRMAAVDDGSPATVLAVRQRQAWLLAHTDRGAEAARLAADALGPARRAGLGVGDLLTVLGCSRAWSGDLPGALEPLEAALTELRAEGRSGIEALLMLGRTNADLLRYAPARRYLEDAYATAQADGDVRSQVEALGHLATLYHALRLEVRAEQAFEEALGLARQIGYRHGEGLNLVNLAAFQLMLGRGGRAYGLFAGAREVFSDLGNGRGEAFVLLNSAELAHWVLGDDATARAQAERAAVYFRKVGNQRLESGCLTLLAGIDRRAGRRRLARRRLGEAVAKARAGADPEAECSAHLGLALVALDLGRPEEALPAVEAGRQLAEESALDAVIPVLLAVRARVLAELGDVDGALATANRAIGLNRPGATLAHLAAWWCAETLVATGDEGAADQVAFAHQLLARHLDDLPADVARSAWAEVAEHRAITAARERYFIQTTEWRLPRASAPSGRPLGDDDFSTVVWTVSHPGDRGAGSAAERRRRRILRLTAQAAEQGAAARVADLAQVLDVSDRTIKRDLAQLRAEGHEPVLRRSVEENRTDF